MIQYAYCTPYQCTSLASQLKTCFHIRTGLKQIIDCTGGALHPLFYLRMNTLTTEYWNSYMIWNLLINIL